MTSKSPVQREQASLLSRQEKRLLINIGGRLPHWVTPDGLTAFGVLGAVLCLVGYVLSFHSVLWLWLVNFGLLIHWFGDSLDGTVARLRKIERNNYGYYLDQTIDTVSNLLMAVGIGLSPYFRLDVSLFALAAYHMLSIHVFVRSVLTREFALDVAGLGPTEMRVGILAANIGILVFGAAQRTTFGIAYTWCDILAFASAVLMLSLFAVAVWKEARRQLERDLASSTDN